MGSGRCTLRASEGRWRNLFEHAPVGIALLGSNGRFVAANPAYQKMVGYSEAERRGLSPVDITHEDDRFLTIEAIGAHAADQHHVFRWEKRYRRKDGNVIWVELSTFLIPVAGSSPLLSGVAVDITERKRAVDDLRRSEASLAQGQQRKCRKWLMRASCARQSKPDFQYCKSSSR